MMSGERRWPTFAFMAAAALAIAAAATVQHGLKEPVDEWPRGDKCFRRRRRSR